MQYTIVHMEIRLLCWVGLCQNRQRNGENRGDKKKHLNKYWLEEIDAMVILTSAALFI